MEDGIMFQKWIVLLLIVALLTGCGHSKEQEDKSSEEVASDLIEETLQHGATELDLSEMGLSQLPPEIWQLTHLERLNLSRNELTELPPEIGELTNLQSLDLASNQLTSLPSE